MRKMHSNIGKNQLYENLIDLHSLETLVKKEFMTNLHFQTCFQQRYKHWKCTKRFKVKNVQEDSILRSQKWPKLTQCLAFFDFKMRGGGQSPKRKTTNQFLWHHSNSYEVDIPWWKYFWNRPTPIFWPCRVFSVNDS